MEDFCVAKALVSLTDAAQVSIDALSAQITDILNSIEKKG